MGEDLIREVQLHLDSTIKAIQMSHVESRLNLAAGTLVEEWRTKDFEAWRRFEEWKRLNPRSAASADEMYAKGLWAWYQSEMRCG